MNLRIVIFVAAALVFALAVAQSSANALQNIELNCQPTEANHITEAYHMNDNLVSGRCDPDNGGSRATATTQSPRVTATPPLAATATPQPDPSPMPSPMPSPVPDPNTIRYEAAADSAIHPDLPQLPTEWHDPTLWHPVAFRVFVDGQDMGVYHADHEHGDNPLNGELDSFGVSLFDSTGGQEISYPWMTPMENQENKHPGYKWTIVTNHLAGCSGREEAPNGTSDFAVQSHNRGNAEEHITHIHSAYGLVRICRASDGQGGILVTGGWQQFGQIVSDYQGPILNLSTQPHPPHHQAREPYISIPCVDDGGQSDCRTLDRVKNTNTTWISEPVNVAGNNLFAILMRSRDIHQYTLGSTRLTTPEFRWLCGDTEFDPENCRATNSTAHVQEVMGYVPPEWDALDGVIDGFVTYQGFTDRWGALVDNCTEAGLDCVPLLMNNVPVGRYGTGLTRDLPRPHDPTRLPSRDVYFCDGVVCTESSPGSRPSGWLSHNN